MKDIHDRINYDETLGIWKDPYDLQPLTFTNWSNDSLTYIENAFNSLNRTHEYDRTERHHAILYLDGKWNVVNDDAVGYVPQRHRISQRYVVCEIL